MRELSLFPPVTTRAWIAHEGDRYIRAKWNGRVYSNDPAISSTEYIVTYIIAEAKQMYAPMAIKRMGDFDCVASCTNIANQISRNAPIIDIRVICKHLSRPSPLSQSTTLRNIHEPSSGAPHGMWAEMLLEHL